jgi:hypothetical protein
MSKVLYSVDDVVELVYDSAINSLVVNWSDLGPHDHLRECLHAQLDNVKSAGAKVILINTAKAHGIFERKDQEWFVSHMVGELREAGVKAIVTVFPEAILPRLASRDWKQTGPQQGVNFIDALNLDMAREVAQQYAF